MSKEMSKTLTLLPNITKTTFDKTEIKWKWLRSWIKWYIVPWNTEVKIDQFLLYTLHYFSIMWLLETNGHTSALIIKFAA